jgi:diguanylate cyclase (GGDEF)-like protein
MARVSLNIWMGSLLILLASLVALPAHAAHPREAAGAAIIEQSGEKARTQASPQERALCTARVPSDMRLATGARWSIDWRCDGPLPALGPGRIAVDLGAVDPGSAADGAAYMQTRTGYLETVTLLALQGGRIAGLARYDADRVPAALTGVGFSLALPQMERQAGTRFVAVFENAEFPTTIVQARLADQPINERSQTLMHLTLIAMMMGFLLLPVVFDLAFFRPLRQSFLLWHAALALIMAWHLSTSGLLGVFGPVSVNAMNDMAIVSYGAMIVCAVMFATRFVEDEAQSPLLRRAMFVWAGVIVVITALRMARLDALLPFSAKLYFAIFVPLMAMIVAFVTIAIRRGSRAIWFQVAAWLPFFLQGLIRVSTMLGNDVSYIEAVWLFRVGAVSEVAITALGIVDRIIQIKRERDDALTEARMLEQLSTLDALTGLLNRRGLEARFDALVEAGFHTFALIDLDSFKQVNDIYGHQVGDAALVACAKALRAHEGPDLVAARLGGEEFVVVLRGKRTVERAEALRNAIPVRIAADVEGLTALVTASSGVVEVPRGSNTMLTFEALYARADALLYEAKASGRNRMLYERLTVFGARPAQRSGQDRRQQDRRASDGAGYGSEVA